MAWKEILGQVIRLTLTFLFHLSDQADRFVYYDSRCGYTGRGYLQNVVLFHKINYKNKLDRCNLSFVLLYLLPSKINVYRN